MSISDTFNDFMNQTETVYTNVLGNIQGVVGRAVQTVRTVKDSARNMRVLPGPPQDAELDVSDVPLADIPPSQYYPVEMQAMAGGGGPSWMGPAILGAGVLLLLVMMKDK